MTDLYEWRWGANGLKRLTKHIRDGCPLAVGDPTYAEVLEWYNDVVVSVATRIGNLDWASVLGSERAEITSRVKTIDTLREKMWRHPGLQVKSVQDFAGVRFEANMSLTQQDRVVAAICAEFDHPAACVHDIRAEPHSGYRAVHVWLRLPANVEVQVRTELQGHWANMYESAADKLGREIRYGEYPNSESGRALVAQLQNISLNKIAALELHRVELERTDGEIDDARQAADDQGAAPALERARIDRERYEAETATLSADMKDLKRAFERLKPLRGGSAR